MRVVGRAHFIVPFLYLFLLFPFLIFSLQNYGKTYLSEYRFQNYGKTYLSEFRLAVDVFIRSADRLRRFFFNCTILLELHILMMMAQCKVQNFFA